MATPTQELIAKTLQDSDTNLCAWAKAHDYKYTTVFNTVKRWAGRNDRTPHGGIARLIMKDLERYVNGSDENPDTQIAKKTPLLRQEVATIGDDKKRVSPLPIV